MKFVFTKEEVANALSMPLAEFEQGRMVLEAHDFPKPIAGLHERWSIIDVINWINRSETKLTPLASFAHSKVASRLN